MFKVTLPSVPRQEGVDDLANYTQPAATSDLKKFSGTATANTSEEAQRIAYEKVTNDAIGEFGNNTTAFAGLQEVNIKINGNVPPYTYTATYNRNAYQVEPPQVSGLTSAEQEAFLLANEGPQGEFQLSLEQQQFLEANGAFDQPTVSSEDPAAQTNNNQQFLEANGVFDPPAIDPDTEFGNPQAAIDANAADDAARAEVDNLLNRYPPSAAGVTEAQNTGGVQSITIVGRRIDNRVRISLASSADYLYMASDITKEDILWPLKNTNGVLFPYTPQINITYSANYDATDLTHSNYKIYNYRSSSVENIGITADFTAQDVFEANYVLAVIHFFRTVTKMFYGKDQPFKGVPPPLVYLTGHGTYNFNRHPAVVNSFTLNYPNDVDYIDAGTQVDTVSYTPASYERSSSSQRLYTSKLRPGGLAPAPVFTLSAKQPPITKIPTKLQLQIGLYPIVTRYNVSNNFSLKKYATGQLLIGSTNSKGGGFW